MESGYDLPTLHCYNMNPTTSDAMTSTSLKQQQQHRQLQSQQQPHANTTTPTPLKRTRAKRSCDFCRQRKSRCDADTSTPCTNCKAWGYTCEFQTVRKKRGPPSVYVDNLEKRCKKMEQLLMQLTNTTIKDLERNDFCATTMSSSAAIHQHRRTISDPSVVSDSTSEEEDYDEDDGAEDDDNYNANGSNSNYKSVDQRRQRQRQRQQEDTFMTPSSSYAGDKLPQSLLVDGDDDNSSIINRLEHLDIQDYDSLKYTGQSAGLELLDQEVFKSKSYITWPGRRDVVLQKMADDQLMVVRTEKSPTSGKLDTRLDVGISITSAITSTTTTMATQSITQSPPLTSSPTSFSPWSSTIDTAILPSPSSPSMISRSTNTTTTASSGSTLVNSNKPSKSLEDKMIKLYFVHLHPILPIINKLRFLHLYKSQSSALPKVVLYSILAVTFRFAAQHSLFPATQTSIPTTATTTSAEHYAVYFFRKVMKRLQDSARSRLCHVQAGILATLYLDMDNSDESTQWHTLGKAIRTAQDLGLHRSCAHWKLPPSEIETRHRVFYACYILDRWISARAGKPLTILDRDFDTALPSMYEVVDDDDGDTLVDGGAKQPLYRAFVLWIKLSEILGRVLKACYAPNAKKANSNANLDDPMILAVFDRRLKHWQAMLEEPVDGSFLPLTQNVSLQIYYNTVILLLRRPFISTSKHATLEHLVIESRQVSLDVAFNMLQLVQRSKSQLPSSTKLIMGDDNDDTIEFSYCFGATHILPTCYIYGMFLSSLVHVAVVLHDRTNLQKQKALGESIDLIDSHSHIRASWHALEILNMLVTIYEIQGAHDKEDTLKKIKQENPVPGQDERHPFLTDYNKDTVDPYYITTPPLAATENENKDADTVFQSSFPPSQQQQHYPSSSSSSSSSISTIAVPVTTSFIESEMPKSQWYQRFVNTSVVGGIPVEIQHDVHDDLSPQRHHLYLYPPSPSPTTTAMILNSSSTASSININPSHLDTPIMTHQRHHDSSMFYTPFIPTPSTTTSSTQLQTYHHQQHLLPSSSASDLILTSSSMGHPHTNLRPQYGPPPPLVLPLPSSTSMLQQQQQQHYHPSHLQEPASSSALNWQHDWHFYMNHPPK